MSELAIAIIQARMSSSRLPGKVLKPLAGQPMIWHIYQRAASCQLVDKVVVATSTEKSDDPLASFCEENGLNVFRGDLNNVLSRFLEILKKDLYPYCVRITGDCPLIWPDFIDQQIAALTKFDGDVVWLKHPQDCVEGQGVHSFRSLFYINETTSCPDDFEHVGSLYLAGHPEEFRIVTFDMPHVPAANPYRLTVDEEKDYQLMEALYGDLYDGRPIDFFQAIKWLDDHPDVAGINKTVIHKKLNLELEEKKRSWAQAPKVGAYQWKWR